MSWASIAIAAESLTGSTATTSVTLSGPVAVGDFIGLGLSFSSGGSATDGVITDSLGNTYTRHSQITDGEHSCFLELWYSFVTHAGTPTITAQFDPTPGTTAPPGLIDLAVTAFSGSDTSSTLDGAGSQQFTASPVSLSPDAIVSGTWATSVDGDLIYSVVNNSLVAGTGFTAANNPTGGDIGMTDEWMEQTTHSASTQATWTATGTSAKAVIAIAVKPAGSGGGGILKGYYYARVQGL